MSHSVDKPWVSCWAGAAVYYFVGLPKSFFVAPPAAPPPGSHLPGEEASPRLPSLPEIFTTAHRTRKLAGSQAGLPRSLRDVAFSLNPGLRLFVGNTFATASALVDCTLVLVDSELSRAVLAAAAGGTGAGRRQNDAAVPNPLGVLAAALQYLLVASKAEPSERFMQALTALLELLVSDLTLQNAARLSSVASCLSSVRESLRMRPFVMELRCVTRHV